MITLIKKFRFESAHRLAKGYAGKCQNIHGHSWNGNIEVIAEDLDKYDFGADFGELGQITKEIENFFDHKIILCKEDAELIELCQQKGWLVIEMQSNPTCEALAQWIYNIIEPKIKALYGERVKLKSVTIEETCTTKCIYHE